MSRGENKGGREMEGSRRAQLSLTVRVSSLLTRFGDWQGDRHLSEGQCWNSILLARTNLSSKITPGAALTGVAQWVGHCLAKRRVAGWIPGQITCLGRGLCPEATHRCFSLSLPPSLFPPGRLRPMSGLSAQLHPQFCVSGTAVSPPCPQSSCL